jgi:hypothetical protein
MKENELPPMDAGRKSGFPLPAALAIGCLVIGLIGIVLCAGVGFFTYRWAMGKVDEVAKQYEDQGYKRITGQAYNATETVTEPTVFVCQVAKLRRGSEADLAFVCQLAEISGTVQGDIAFYGQMLTIKPDGVVKGDLFVQAGQVINVQGVVEGEITGSYQDLIRREAKNP